MAIGRGVVAAILGSLAACATVPPPAPSPAPTAPAAPARLPPAAAPTPPAAAPAGPTPVPRSRAQWLPASFADLPGWEQDRVAELWPALRQGCARPVPEAAAAWAAFCARALRVPPADDAAARALIERELRPWSLRAPQGEAGGLATGYFEPVLAASRTPKAGFAAALHRPPADLGRRKPYWTRKELDTEPAARAALRGRELAWVPTAMDALMLQIQGSGKLRIAEADGRERLVRVAFAGTNDQPYRSVGSWLIEQGEVRAGGANWPAIRDWAARARPERLAEMLWSNPRYVFFAEEPIADPALGPRGALGVPLTAGRSVAVDRDAVPLGTLLWLDTTEPLSAAPLRRLVAAQDTGSAITGAVRIDYFWGSGDDAEQRAGRMKQPLRAWALWPR